MHSSSVQAMMARAGFLSNPESVPLILHGWLTGSCKPICSRKAHVRPCRASRIIALPQKHELSGGVIRNVEGGLEVIWR